MTESPPKWKGQTFNQIVSSIQKNHRYIPVHDLSINDIRSTAFRAQPFKHYRREIANVPLITPRVPRTGVTIDTLNQPGGTISIRSYTTPYPVGLEGIVLDAQEMGISSNRTSCNTVGLCAQTNARRRCRSSGIVKNNYNTSSELYLNSRNKTFDKNRFLYMMQDLSYNQFFGQPIYNNCDASLGIYPHTSVTYKPSGATDAGAIVLKKKFVTIANSIAQFKAIYGDAVSNAMGYGLSTSCYSYKGKIHYPLECRPLKCPNIHQTSSSSNNVSNALTGIVVLSANNSNALSDFGAIQVSDVTIDSSASLASFVISWSGASGVGVSYSFSVNSSPNGFQVHAVTPQSGAATTSYRISELALLPPTTPYSVVITAANANGRISSPIQIFAQPPSPFGVFDVSNVNIGGFLLSWSGGIGYNVTYTFAINGAGVTPTLTSYGYLFSGLLYPTSSPYTWSLVVDAVNDGGYVVSDPITIVPPIVLPPTQFISVTPTNISDSGFSLTFTGGTGTGVTYQFFLNGVRFTPTTDPYNIGWYSFQNLTYPFAYPYKWYVTIIASNVSGTTNVTSPDIIPPPYRFGNFMSSNVSISGFLLSWTGGSGHDVSYSFTIDGSMASAYPTTPAVGYTSSYFFSGLTYPTDLSWSVVVDASNEGGNILSLPQTVYPPYLPSS
jgi:hypothetical protein